MKRYIRCAVNKTKALEALAEYEREIFYGNGYEVKIDKKHNCVIVERYNQMQLVLTPAEVPTTVTGFEGCLKLDKTNYRYNDTHKKSNEAKQRKVKHAEYDTIDDWYMSSDGEIDDDKFAENLEKLVRNKFDVSDYFEEPSIQGFEGEDIISIKLHDGSEYYFSFSWSDMQETIYSDGPEAAANYYFNEIKEGIESGSASTDTPTL